MGQKEDGDPFFFAIPTTLDRELTANWEDAPARHPCLGSAAVSFLFFSFH